MSGANSTVLGDTVLQSDVLESNAAAVNYHGWLCSLAMPYLGDDPLEIGSGLGDYAVTWLEWGQPKITVTEVDPSRAAVLHAKFDGDGRVAFGAIELDGVSEGDYSAVVSFNVLEHIPDDVAALRAARHLVRPGGYVVTFAPAFPIAMSTFDRAIGHVRRYRRRVIEQRYAAAGLEVVECRYVNAPGLIAWFVGMRVLRMIPKDGPTLSMWDRWVVPAARRWETKHPAPFGQSILCVGRRPLDADPTS
jgi:SAM-dependent methyltransferase